MIELINFNETIGKFLHFREVKFSLGSKIWILSCTLNDACIDSAWKMLKLISILVLRILKCTLKFQICYNPNMLCHKLSFKGQLKRRDKLTSIARFWSPENGFEGIFEKFVFVLEISAVKVEELCRTNSRFSSFSEKILSGDFCIWRHWWSLLWVGSWCSYRTKEFVSSEPGPREFILKIFKEYFVVCPVELQGCWLALF